MPLDHKERERRLDTLLRLVKRGRYPSQRDLLEALRTAGFDVTQSSVSRDLRDLGIVKDGGRYQVRGPDRRPEPAPGLEEVVRAFVARLAPAGAHLLVVHTAVGAAARVALAIDEAEWGEVAGTLAGDDTVFVALPGQREQRKVQERLERMAAGGVAP